MTAPIPEEQDQPPIVADDPPGEHDDDLPDEHDATTPAEPRTRRQEQLREQVQGENAETSLDEPSDGSGGE